MQPVQNTSSTPKKKTKFMDTKIFIASLAVAVTIGLWNLLSNDAVQADKAAPTPIVAPPPQPPAGESQGFPPRSAGPQDGLPFPPLPTLVPLMDAPAQQANGQQAAGAVPAPQAQGNPQSGALRSVTAPDQAIVQKSKPVFDQGVVTIVNGGGGGRSASAGGSSSAPAPVTNTGSSKK